MLPKPGNVNETSLLRDAPAGIRPAPNEYCMGSVSADHVEHVVVKVSVRAVPTIGDTVHEPPHGGCRIRHECDTWPTDPPAAADVHDRVMVYVLPKASTSDAGFDCKTSDRVVACHPVPTNSSSLYGALL